MPEVAGTTEGDARKVKTPLPSWPWDKLSFGDRPHAAPGFTVAKKDEYRAAFDAVVPMAIDKAKSQKEGKLKS